MAADKFRAACAELMEGERAEDVYAANAAGTSAVLAAVAVREEVVAAVAARDGAAVRSLCAAFAAEVVGLGAFAEPLRPDRAEHRERVAQRLAAELMLALRVVVARPAPPRSRVSE